MSIRNTLLAAAALPAVLASSSYAALLAYEGFNYQPPATPAGSAVFGLNGGTNWNAAWIGNNDGFKTAPDGGLGYGSLSTSTGAIADTSGSSKAYIRASNATAIASSDTKTRWFSMLLNVNSLNATAPVSNTLAIWSGLSSAGANSTQRGSNVGFQIDATVSSGYQMYARVGTTLSSASYGISAPTGTLFIVGKYSANPTGNDFSEIWVNPNTSLLGGTNLTNGSTAEAYLSVGAGSSIDAVSFAFNAVGTYGSSLKGSLDEVRIGDTFADVSPVPEPASIAGLAVLGFLATRRRR